MEEKDNQEMYLTYFGGCHCKKVRFEVKAEKELTVYKCNCEFCNMKQLQRFVVNKKDFHLVSGDDSLAIYTFNTRTAKHKFCKICGVESFWIPKDHPEEVCVVVFCLDSYEKVSYKVIDQEGKICERKNSLES